MSFDGTTPPDYIVRRLRSGEGTGVILFAKNAPDAPALRALTTGSSGRRAAAALVATDQEGGDIRTLPFLPPQLAGRWEPRSGHRGGPRHPPACERPG